MNIMTAYFCNVMKIHTDISNLPSFKNAVITIGTFDGVHEGHKRVIGQLVEDAKEIDGESVIITFHPHPRKIVSSSILGIRLLNTIDERIELIDKLGVDHLVITPFTEVFANMAPESYVEQFLVAKFLPKTIIIGYDHRFGKDREGDINLLAQLQAKYNYNLIEIPKHILDNISISSTKIREALLKGDSKCANTLLGYHYFFEGEVVHGDKIGRTLGYPTANLKLYSDEKIVPTDGIYAVYADIVSTKELPSEKYKGMMSIGFRPTVDGRRRVIEVNLFDFDQEIYGETVRVYVKKYLRKEIKYDNLNELVTQIGQDKIESLAIL